MTKYKPAQKILEKYADVLINFALNSGKGVKKDESVFLNVSESAKPLLIELRKAVLRAGANPILNYSPEGIARDFYDLAGEEQLTYFPKNYLKGLVEEADHFVSIIADADPHELRGVPPEKIMKRQKVFKPYMDWKNEKEDRGELTWTLALYGTEGLAKEAGLSLEEYWNQIIKACYLDEEDPIQKWREAMDEVDRVKDKLDSLNIEKLWVKGENSDLIIGLGKNRKWLGGSGRNIPSFEVFISPDCRLTEGRIKFTEPLYRYGNLIKGVYLEFKDGKVVKASADEGEEVLKEMIATEGADMVGEFSLTDSRLSRITKFMATTLFDENVGGKYGNTHLALGRAYKESYPGDPSKVIKKEWEEMGYNDSVVHTDIVSTENREVIAFLEDGSEKVIYKDGKFQI